jgi:DNA-binding NarL/FixJ family response regulator
MSARAVVVAHREPIVAEGLASALKAFPGLVPIATASTLDEGARCGARADAIAIDARMTGAQDLAAQLRRLGVRVVFIGGRNGDDEDGIRIPVSAPVASLASALAPGVVPRRKPVERSLTARQLQILALAGKGMAAKQIARALGISAKTVERHKTNIFEKLHVPNMVAAVGAALEHNLI